MRLATAATTLFVLTLSLPSQAADKPQPSPQPTTNEESAQPADAEPVVASGIRVYIDPQTGRRTSHPTDEQRRAAAAQDALNRNLEGHDAFTTETLPSGAILLRTHGRNQSVVMAKPGADGKARVQCTDPLHQHLSGTSSQIEQTSPSPNDER